MEKKAVRVFVLAKILERAGQAWFFSTYILFLQSIGLSLLEANLLNTIFMTISTVLDPFTGNWGDRIGQKRIYLAGILFWVMGHFSYGLAKVFLMCAVAEALSAVGRALMSQALESWLRNMTNEEITQKALGVSKFWSQIASVPVVLLGGYVGSVWGLEWPWFLGAATTSIVLVTVWWQLRGFSERTTKVVQEIDLSLWTITRNVWKDPVLRQSFIAAAGLSACFQSFNMFWPVVFKNLSGATEWLGTIWVGIALAAALGGYLAKSIKANARNLSLIVLSIGLPMLIPLVPGFWMLTSLTPFLVHEIGRSTWEPILFSYTNRRIKDEVRTSVNSLGSAAGTLGAAIGLLVSGVMTTWFTPVQVWAISAIALIMIAVWIWRWNHD
jgi:DHA1 family tetracycline resistance protein-like MFS transporter